MKIFTCFILVLVTSNCIIAQKTYTINGTVANVEKGKIYLINSAPEAYYKNNVIDSALIINGSFSIKKKFYTNISTAHRFIIVTKNNEGSTGTILLNPEDAQIKIDTINEYISPTTSSALINKEQVAYNLKFYNIIKEAQLLNRIEDSLYANSIKISETKFETLLRAERQKLRKKSDSLLSEYIIDYPNSYFGLWKLIERLDNLGFDDIYMDMYHFLSNEIQKTFPAITLYEKLSSATALSIGKRFPILTLKNQSSKIIKLNASKIKAKYILVDFWFSECSPCLKEFQQYKSIYNKFQRTDFEIIAISVDSQDKKELWLETIKNRQLNWINYNVINDSLSSKYNINSFPTNYLLDDNGQIIVKNISIKELENFLKKLNSDLFFNDKTSEPE